MGTVILSSVNGINSINAHNPEINTIRGNTSIMDKFGGNNPKKLNHEINNKDTTTAEIKNAALPIIDF